MIRFLMLQFEGDPNIGMYGFATDSYCILGKEVSLKAAEKIYEILKVNIKTAFIAGTEFPGLFAAGNSNGIIIPKIAEKSEINALRKLDVNILITKNKETALGNLILCNDNGCIISKKLRQYKKEVKDCLDCEVEVGTMAGLEIVGSAGRASNFGCLCHRNVSEEEIKKIEEVLKVKADVGSVSGSPFVKAGIIVNSHGILASEESTGPELGRMQEVFTPQIV